jgi:TetR/AcrR family transcriptional regulator, cholesterol catabolism regulator
MAQLPHERNIKRAASLDIDGWLEELPYVLARVDRPSTICRNELTGRCLSEKQVVVVNRLIEAAVAEAGLRPYAQITVRTIAKRAGVSAATSYTYFSSKEHLLAAVLWQQIGLELCVEEMAIAQSERMAEVTRPFQFNSLGPSVAGACTIALTSDVPEARDIRERIFAEMRRRLERNVANTVDASAIDILQMVWIGAFLSAGLGHLAYTSITPIVTSAAALAATHCSR